MKFLVAAVLSFGFLLTGLTTKTTFDTRFQASGQNGTQKSSAADLIEADQLDKQMTQLYKEGKFDKALVLAKRVAEIREKALGVDHPSVATSLYNVAILLLAKGKYDDAAQFLQRVIEIKEKSLGVMHPDVGKILEEYACLLWGRGKKDEAEKIEKRIGRILYADKDYTEVDDLIRGKPLSIPQPSYPDEARRARMAGTVVVRISIDETGKVVQASGRCADPLLVKVSEAAAFKARFKPTLVAGKPTKVVARITYNFVPR